MSNEETTEEPIKTADTQFQRLLQIIESEFREHDPERADALLAMYTDLEEQIKYAPASSKVHFHNAYPGGYIDHILNVYDNSLEMVKVFARRGGKLNFNKRELVFAALHHDLGKIGDKDAPYYIEEKSQWHREKLGQIYKRNSNPFVSVEDRTFWLLNNYGIKYTKNEMLAIKLADGLYAEGNAQYLKNNDEFPIHTALPYIIHWADHMACVTEKLNLFFLMNSN